MKIEDLDKKYCVGLGEILFDVLPTGSQLGGAPANFAYHAGQHGLHSVAVSAVGSDLLGDEALRLLDDKHLKYVMPRVDFPTGTVQVELDAEGVPTYDIKEVWHGTTSPSPTTSRRWLPMPELYAGALWLGAAR